MNKPEVVQTLHREIEIAGRMHAVQVDIAVTDDLDSDPLDSIFESEEEKEATREKLNNGTLRNVGVIVTAYLCGEKGQDSLWNCIIGDGCTVDMVVEDNSMIASALCELRNNLAFQYKSLKTLFSKKGK